MSLGPHEFDVYMVPYYGVFDAARFALEWEPSWHVQSYEVCYGTIQSGDPATPGSTLVFSFDDCDIRETPILRIWMDCSTNGTFRMRNGEVRYCGSEYWETEYYRPHCDIGDFCGMSHDNPCDYCLDEDAGGFDPPSLDLILPRGVIRILTLHVWGEIGGYCPGLPECGEHYGDCFGGLRTDRAWLSASVDWMGHQEGVHNFPYDLTVNPGSLPPGDYDGRVYTIPGCPTCRENCMQVHMTLLDPADASLTDGAEIPLLGPIAPNPSRGMLSYTIRLETPGRVSVEVIDVTGRVVARPADSDLAKGVHRLRWNAAESRLTSGIYFLRVSAPGERQSRLFVLSR